MTQREILAQRVVWEAQEYFVYFKPSKARAVAKDPLRRGKTLQGFAE